jgi:PhnB protein
LKDGILHSSLTSRNLVILASDLNREKPVEGNTVHLCIICKSESELNLFFTKLSAEGMITER